MINTGPTAQAAYPPKLLVKRLPRPVPALSSDADESFPFSVAGGLRRRLERHQAIFGTPAEVERVDYLEMRGSSLPSKWRHPASDAAPSPPAPSPPMVSPVKITVVPQVIRQPEAAPAPAPPAPIPAPTPTAAAPAPVATPPTPLASLAPTAPPSTETVVQTATPSPIEYSVPPPAIQSAWKVVDQTAVRRAVAAETPAKAQSQSTWNVIDNDTLRRASATMLIGHAQNWQHNNAADLPQKTSWQAIDVAATLTATDATLVMQDHLAKNSPRNVLINAAIWATVLTVVFGLAAVVFHH